MLRRVAAPCGRVGFRFFAVKPRVDVRLSSSTQYCQDETKKKDYWSWYCSQFLPKPVSDANTIFHALHHELINPEAQIRGPSKQQSGSSVSAAQAKQMRVQWWKEAINNSFQVASRIKAKKGKLEIGEIPAHPILQAIFSLMMEDISLSKTLFAGLFRSHADLSFPVTIEDLERYGKDSMGSIMALTLECYWKECKDITPTQKLDIEHSITHLAIAISIFQLLRATPLHLSRRVCFLPVQLLSKHKISTEDLHRGKANNDHFSEVIYDVASVAHLNLQQSEKLRKNLPPAVKPLFLHSVIVQDYLDELQKNHFNIYHKNLQITKPLKWQMRVLWNHWAK